MFTTWRKSTYSDSSGGNCVEAGRGTGADAGAVGVRDTKDRERGQITVSTNAFGQFRRAAARGWFGWF